MISLSIACSGGVNKVEGKLQVMSTVSKEKGQGAGFQERVEGWEKDREEFRDTISLSSDTDKKNVTYLSFFS